MNTNSLYTRTDKAIIHTFIEILKEKPFEKITIQDILDRTPVSRGTFYAHFHDKYEIAETILNQFLQDRKEYRDALKAHPKAVWHQSYLRTVPESKQELYQLLLNIHTESVDLRRSIIQEFAEEYLEETQERSPDAQIEARLYAHMRTELELILNTTEGYISLERFAKILRNISRIMLTKIGDT